MLRVREILATGYWDPSQASGPTTLATSWSLVRGLQVEESLPCSGAHVHLPSELPRQLWMIQPLKAFGVHTLDWDFPP